MVDTGSSNCTIWRLESREHMLACFPSLLAESGYICGGLTRMLREPTEPVFRRAATMMWPAEISHELKSTAIIHGEEKLYLNFQWVLFDEFRSASCIPPRTTTHNHHTDRWFTDIRH